MNTQLKKEIFLYMMEHHNEFQTVNNAAQKFRQYIYTSEGDYCIGGEEVMEFIRKVDKL